MKRYLYIIIGIVVAAVIVILVLFLIKNRAAGPSLVTSGTGSLPAANTQGIGGSSSTGSESSGSGTLGLAVITGSSTAAASGQMTPQKFGVLSNNPVLTYFVDPHNNITAIEPTGEIFTISNGQSTIVNSSTINDIISASFSYDGKKILVNYGASSNPQSGVFDLAANTWTSLPQGMTSPQWSPVSNYQIAYLVTTNNGKLALATIDASNLKAAASVLLSLSANDIALQWPTKSEFILSDRPTSKSLGSVWAFNSLTGTFSPVLYEVSGAESTWSNNVAFPYGLLFSTANGGNRLQLQALSGPLPIESLTFATLPSKCTFNTELMPIATSTTATSSTSTTTSTATSSTKKATTPAKAAPTSTPYLALYCGIPRSSSGFSSAHLPDDYNMMALFTSDNLYKVNTETGVIQPLWNSPTQNMDVSDLKFFNNALFFVNRYDNKLYGLTFAN